MNPGAILTPGGIADQLTHGLSGVAQALAQRSQIQRQDRQQQFDNNQSELRSALAQAAEERQSAAQALSKVQWETQHATQVDQFNQNHALNQQQQMDRERAAQQQDLYQNPEAYTASPSPAMSGTAQRLSDRNTFRDASQGYVHPEEQRILPGVDWRTGLPAGGDQPAFGPTPGSPAAQGLDAYHNRMSAHTRPTIDRMGLQNDAQEFRAQQDSIKADASAEKDKERIDQAAHKEYTTQIKDWEKARRQSRFAAGYDDLSPEAKRAWDIKYAAENGSVEPPKYVSKTYMNAQNTAGQTAAPNSDKALADAWGTVKK